MAVWLNGEIPNWQGGGMAETANCETVGWQDG